MARKGNDPVALLTSKHIYLTRSPKDSTYVLRLDVLNYRASRPYDVVIFDVGVVVDHPGTYVLIVAGADDPKRDSWELVCTNPVEGEWSRSDAEND